MLAFLSTSFTPTLPRVPSELSPTLLYSEKATSEEEKEHISWLHNMLLFSLN